MTVLHQESVPTQAVYRVLLQAMSRPGTRMAIPWESGWNSALEAVAATLFDHEVSFCCLSSPRAREWQDRLFTLTKARVALPGEADYLVIDGGESGGAATAAKVGTLTYPDRSATLFYVVEAPCETAGSIRLNGPGIRETTVLREPVLSLREWRTLKAVNSDFPLGVDAFILDPLGEVLAVPRSTYIAVEEG